MILIIFLQELKIRVLSLAPSRAKLAILTSPSPTLWLHNLRASGIYFNQSAAEMVIQHYYTNLTIITTSYIVQSARPPEYINRNTAFANIYTFPSISAIPANIHTSAYSNIYTSTRTSSKAPTKDFTASANISWTLQGLLWRQ